MAPTHQYQGLHISLRTHTHLDRDTFQKALATLRARRDAPKRVFPRKKKMASLKECLVFKAEAHNSQNGADEAFEFKI